MSVFDIYDDLGNTDLGEKLLELKQQNDKLHTHIESLEKDVQKLCTELLQMKKVEDNLKKNISELYNTAKNEIERKDRMIAELRTELDNVLFRRRNRHTVNNSNSRPGSPKTKRNREDIRMECESNIIKRIKQEPENDPLVKLIDPKKERTSRSRSNSTHRNDRYKSTDRGHHRTRSHSSERESSQNYRESHHYFIKKEPRKNIQSKDKDGPNTQSRSKSRDKERGSRSRSNSTHHYDPHKSADTKDRCHHKTRSNSREKEPPQNHRDSHHAVIKREPGYRSHSNSKENTQVRSRSKDSDVFNIKSQSRSRDKERHYRNNEDISSKHRRDHSSSKRSREHLDEKSSRHSDKRYSRPNDNQDYKKGSRSDYKDSSSKLDSDRRFKDEPTNSKSDRKGTETNKEASLTTNRESDIRTRSIKVEIDSISEGIQELPVVNSVNNNDTERVIKTEKTLAESNTSTATQDHSRNDICDIDIKTEPNTNGVTLGQNQSDKIKLNAMRRRRCVIKIID